MQEVTKRLRRPRCSFSPSKEGEILQVGDDVRIYIKRIKGNWVRLCIDAPKSVELRRIPAPAKAAGDREEDDTRFVRMRRRSWPRTWKKTCDERAFGPIFHVSG
ncbi:MAG: hypothetical protein GY913_24885 [Proteobacteria bacterium]|nr:hypothetical protein [Pseudomonadota bacterium]MCP4920151.1 hypothetical protein [Pseudomonadota bacterium]